MSLPLAGTTESAETAPRASGWRPGSWSRRRKAAIVLAVTSAIGLSGLAGASMASAASIATVEVGPVPPGDAQNEGNPYWGRAWDLCTTYHPGTRSVHWADVYPIPGDKEMRLIQIWSCDDKP